MSKWQMVPLGEVIRLRKEFIQIDDFESYKRCRVQLHARGVVLRDTAPGGGIKTKKQQVCKGGELLVAEIDAKHGGYGIVPDDLDGAIVSSHYFLFEIDQARLDRRFLGYYIRTPRFFDQVSAQGSTNYAAIRPGHVLEYLIPLPPLSEQQRVVEWIDAVAGRVEEAQKLRCKSNSAQNALRAAAASQVIEPLEFSGRLKDALLSKPRNGWSARCDGLDTGVPVLALGAVTGFEYRSRHVKRTSESTNPAAHYWLSPGDLLITRSNTPELVGHAAIYDGNPAPCIYPDLMMRLEVDTRRFSTRFVYFVLRTRKVREYIRQQAKGTSPTMKKISQPVVQDIPFPSRCPLAEQQKLVAILDRLYSELRDASADGEDIIGRIDALLASILTQAFDAMR